MQLSDQLRRRTPIEVGLMAMVFVFLLAIIFSLLPEAPPDVITNFCPQPEILPLKGDFLSSSEFFTSEYAKYSLETLQGAIRIPTISLDVEYSNSDAGHRVFKTLHKYLLKTFPLASKNVEIVNEYGLLFTFSGKNSSLKPIVLMAHQDVVPVPNATLDEWKYPPFEAVYDGEWLYGRGVADTKDSLVGILEATESLLQQKWEPERTLILSFGFDEEIGGKQGAASLARTIEKRYGKDGIEFILDEGFGLPFMHGSLVGAVTVGEKGYVDVEASVFTPGGHSSAPPDHTGIGIMSQLVKTLEAHPFVSILEDNNPILPMYRCLAEHAPAMNKEFRRTVLDIDADEHRNRFINHVAQVPTLKYWIRTSQAVDVIDGGVKENALPERVDVKVNHRISLDSSVTSVVERFEHFASEIAREYGIGVESLGKVLIDPTDKGHIKISVSQKLEPAPLSPYTGFGWDLIGSTTRSIFEAVGVEEPVVMAPSLFPANTDTRHYWDLTRAIYRFKPVLSRDIENYHTVNERLRFKGHLATVAWFYELIINATL